MKTEPIVFGFDEILEAAYESGEKREGIHFVGRADFYVYLDFRVSTGGIFYVGKGNSARVKQKSRRGAHHARIVKKHRLSRVAFPIAKELEALDIEKQLVDAIGRLDLQTGPLVNTCDGGGAPANFGPEVIEKIRENNGMRRPEVKARHAAALADPDVKARQVANIKAALADPGVKARQVANIKAAMADPDVKARHAAAIADPDVKARHAAAMADPDVKARYAAAMADPDVKARQVANIKAAMADPDVKARQAESLRGERNPMHGKTQSPEAKAKIKAAVAEQKLIAEELGLKFNEVTKAVIAQYRAGKAK